jgi:hypothetical protein
MPPLAMPSAFAGVGPAIAAVAHSPLRVAERSGSTVVWVRRAVPYLPLVVHISMHPAIECAGAIPPRWAAGGGLSHAVGDGHGVPSG